MTEAQCVFHSIRNREVEIAFGETYDLNFIDGIDARYEAVMAFQNDTARWLERIEE